MNNRRDFFRKASIFGVAALAPVATTVVVTMPKDKPNEDASHLKPEGNHNLVLNGGLKARGGTQVTDANGTSVYFMEPITAEYNNKVEMSVGKDNRLWIKVDEEWKRVAIES
jgi:hypothetical protein